MRFQLVICIYVCAFTTVTGMDLVRLNQPTARVVPLTTNGPIALPFGVLTANPTEGLIHSQTKGLFKYTKLPDAEITVDSRAFPRVCIKYNIDFPLSIEIAFGKVGSVQEYFENWYGIFAPGEHQRCMVQCLYQAAQLERSKTKDIITFLLSKVHPSFIERPDCLLDNAIDKGHLELIEYIKKKFAFPYTAWAFMEAIGKNDQEKVETLLRAGVSPDVGIGTKDQPQVIVYDDQEFMVLDSKHAHYPLHVAAINGNPFMVATLIAQNANVLRADYNGHTPVIAALYGFSTADTPEVMDGRFAVLKTLLAAMPEDKRPLPIESQLNMLPLTAKERVREIFCAFPTKQPPHICMTEEVVEKAQKTEKRIILSSVLVATFCVGWSILLQRYCCKESEKQESKKDSKNIRNSKKNR